MKRVSAITMSSVLICCSLSAASIDEPISNQSTLQIVSVEPTPEPDEIEIRIVYPSKEELKKSLPIRFEARLDGYVVG
ncbi:MAG: hypothetical protein EB051_04420, partial [Chlamydiia bacterium]|nr:hypothetical protein [Chlamydiia bacterium]